MVEEKADEVKIRVMCFQVWLFRKKKNQTKQQTNKQNQTLKIRP